MVLSEGPSHVDVATLASLLLSSVAGQEHLRAQHQIFGSVRLDREPGMKVVNRVLRLEVGRSRGSPVTAIFLIGSLVSLLYSSRR